MPVPAVAGYIKHSARTAKIIKYFKSVANFHNSSIKSSTKIAKLFARNINFNFTRRSWSKGRGGNKVANAVGHFVKHGQEFGAKTVKDYYNKANNFLDSGNYKILKGKNGDLEYFNAATNTLAITDEGNSIKSYYKVGLERADDFNKRISKGDYIK